MTTLALIVLVLWGIVSLQFLGWKKGVSYPPKSGSLVIGQIVYELSVLALCLWVIFS